MGKNISSYFKGDRKYFAIVFFILVLIITVGLITPILVEKQKSNWETELSEKILIIKDGIKNLLAEKESRLTSVKNQVKSELHQRMVTTEYEYGSLISLVNKESYEDYSIEIVAPNGKIIAWNKIIAIKQEEIFPFVYPINEVHFLNSPLITYMTIIDTVILHGDRFYILLSKPFEKNYYLQNKYYKQVSFTEELSGNFNTVFNVYYDPYAQPSKDGRKHSVILLNSNKSKIGLASFFKPSLSFELTEIQETAVRIQVLLLILGLFFLTLGLKSDFRMIKWRSVRLLALIIYFAILRFVLYWSGFPSRFLDGPLVDPSYFSSTFAWGIVKTPVEFFVTNVFLLVIGIKFFFYIFDYFKENNTRFTLLKFLITPLLAIITFYTLRGLAASIKSVIFDSTIRYFKEPDLIPSLPTLLMNLNILIFTSAAVFVIIAFILLIGKYLKLLGNSKSILRFSILFILVLVGCLIFFHNQREPLITDFMCFVFLSLIFWVIGNLIYGSKPVSSKIIYPSLIASVIAISMLNYFNLELEKRSLKVIAYEVNRANKELLTYLVDETLRNSIQNERLISSFYKLNYNYDSEAFIAWSKSSLQRESLSSELVILDRNFNLLGRFSVGFDEALDYKKLLNQISENGTESKVVPLNSQVGIGFAGIVPVENDNIVAGYVAVAARFSIENLGAADFPDFLESNKAALGSVVDLNLIRIFEFKDGKVSQTLGNIFPSKEQRDQIFSVNLSPDGDGFANISFYGENYITFILRTNSEGFKKTTVVAIKDKEVTWSLYNFFKIFLIHSIFILLIILILIGLKYIRLEYSFRTKLLGAFLLVSIIPIIALAVYNREVVRERTNNAVLNELGKRSEYLENHIRAQKLKHSDRDYLTAFENAAKELKIAFAIYDENSERIYSSKKEYYENRLIPEKLNSQVHYNLNYLSYREALIKESIDNYAFDAYYRKIDFGNKSFILGVNDAFNRIELSYSPVDLDVFLFGVYSFAVIIITLLSTIFANQISSPIRQLTRATKAVAQGDLNVQLTSKEKGEMKELFDGFNAMTGELQKNQNDIAELERETAWKEMAKQVAHEIKNPLTPMKLSVQQIVASYNDKRAEFDEILKKLSQAILNQIDNLSQIASEFSSFAKMPSLKLEVFDLIPVIKDIVHLFGDEEAKIKFNSNADKVFLESDSSQMRRMFINLIRNSIQAKSRNININITIENSYSIIDISDDGVGISVENQSKIFETNFTTKEKGLGLGLKLIKRFLENTGGEIKLISSSDSGTVFRIRIPLKSS